jgi:hypothetical protein
MLLWKHGPERLLAWHARLFASICEGLVGGSEGSGSVVGLLPEGPCNRHELKHECISDMNLQNRWHVVHFGW